MIFSNIKYTKIGKILTSSQNARSATTFLSPLPHQLLHHPPRTRKKNHSLTVQQMGKHTQLNLSLINRVGQTCSEPGWHRGKNLTKCDQTFCFDTYSSGRPTNKIVSLGITALFNTNNICSGFFLTLFHSAGKVPLSLDEIKNYICLPKSHKE